jgi:DNA-binding transcriptional ArsR family regulator
MVSILVRIVKRREEPSMRNKTIGDVIAEGRLRTFMDPRLVKALGHPVREHILIVLNERIASPTEIGRELGLEVEDFYHHVEVLEELGCIERVETKRRRGATEYFFRATSSLVFDDDEWARLPPTLRFDLSAEGVKPIFDDVATAMRCETFDAREDRHTSWLPAYLDEEGWHEVLALLEETLWRAIEIRTRSAARLAKRDERGTPATVAILGFEMPDRREAGREPATRPQLAAPVPGRHPASAR